MRGTEGLFPRNERSRGQAVRIHPIVVLLAVGGGQVAGLAGAILAVPALRDLLDSLRLRLCVRR